MFFWSNQEKKSVLFDEEVADKDLLEVIEKELESQPDRTFSDLCKEALRQYFSAPQSLPSNFTREREEQSIAELQLQFAEFEQRFLTRETSQLDAIERQIRQLTDQLQQLGMSVEQPLVSETMEQTETEDYVSTEEDDPVLSHINSLIDDF